MSITIFSIRRSFLVLFGVAAVISAAWFTFSTKADQTIQVTFQDGLNNYLGTTDTYISSNNKTTNYGATSTVYASGSARPLVKFDLSSIPANATVQSATLSLYIYSNLGNGGGTSVYLHRLIDKSWNETQATWNIYATGQNWTTAGMGATTDYATPATASANIGYTPVNIWADFTVTSLVQNWINGGFANNGITILTQNGPRFNAYSSEYNGNITLRPKLSVTYTVPGNDTTPPVRSAGAPSGSLPVNTTQATLSLATDELATCKYGTIPNTIFTSLPTTFSTTTGTTHSTIVSGLVNGTAYTYFIRCQDSLGNTNEDDFSIAFNINADMPPSVPTNLNATPISISAINLSWTAATDDIGVSGYQIYRDSNQIATSTTTNYSDSGLMSSTTYSYTVSAFDTAGQFSAQSSAVNATTLTPDTQAPTTPTDLNIISVSSATVNLNWATSTDNVAVTGYRVFRNNVQVATSTLTSYADQGLASQTQYSYIVDAFDANANISSPSNTVATTTLASLQFSFLTYGDSRSGTDCSGNATHIGLINRMFNENSRFVVHNGDMITGFASTTNWVQNGPCTNPASLGSFKNMIAPIQNQTPPEGLATTFFPVIGNHDDGWGDNWYPDPFGDGFCDVFNPQTLVPNHTQQSYFVDPDRPHYSDSQFYSLACSKSVRDVYPAYMYYSFNNQNSHFAVLRVNVDHFNLEVCNSCLGDKTNYDDYYNIHQLDWLKADLVAADANPNIENIFIFLHAPLFGSSWGHANNASNFIIAKELSKHPKVKIVFSGHSHVYERSVPITVNDANPTGVQDNQNGIVYITTGGGGSGLHGFTSAAWYSAVRNAVNHYLKIIVNGTGISVQAIDKNGNIIDTYTE